MAKFGLSGLAAKLTGQSNKVAEEVQQKTEEVKQETSQAAPMSGLAAILANQSNKVASEVQKKAEEVKQAAQVEELNIIDASQKLFKDSREITIKGALPGIAFSKMTAAFGEPVDRGDNTFTFDNGMTVEVDGEKNIVKKISVINGDIVTPEGVAVNMEETILNTTYETADEVDVKSNGADYKYFNKKKTRKFTFVSRGGYITKIESELLK